MRRAALLASAVAALACSSSNPVPTAGLLAPAAVAAFRGVTAQRPAELGQYVAVAASRANDVRLIDASTDRPVLGPTRVFPLSVPTDARPLRLAATSLGDVRTDESGATIPADLPDLLVVASVGGPVATSGPAVDLVVTWETRNRIALQVPIEGAPPGAVISALAAAPVPGVPGRGRVAVALSTAEGGALALVDFERRLVEVSATPDGKPQPPLATIVPVPGATVFGPLAAPAGRFTALDLAFSPEGSRLFAATPDPLAPSTFGVAQLEMAAAPAIPTATALDAGGPTTVVAAGLVAERVIDPAGAESFAATPVLRVYAALDPAGCGEGRAVSCGIARLDPAAPTLRPAPLAIPGGLALDVAISGPPQTPVSGSTCAAPATLRLDVAGVGPRCTNAVAAVPSSDGNVYLLDLARFEIPVERTATTESPYLRRPSGAVLPIGAVAVDRSAIPGGAGKLEIRYYVGYSGDELFVFGPGEGSGAAFVIR